MILAPRPGSTCRLGSPPRPRGLWTWSRTLRLASFSIQSGVAYTVTLYGRLRLLKPVSLSIQLNTIHLISLTPISYLLSHTSHARIVVGRWFIPRSAHSLSPAKDPRLYHSVHIPASSLRVHNRVPNRHFTSTHLSHSSSPLGYCLLILSFMSFVTFFSSRVILLNSRELWRGMRTFSILLFAHVQDADWTVHDLDC